MAVGQETNLGQFPKQEKKGNTRKIAAGILAVAVLGGGAFAATQLNRNEGSSTNPELTPPAGGIVEPSATLPVSPSASIELPTASPVAATPEVTPKPTESAAPMPSIQEVMNTLLNQPDKDIKSVSIEKIKDSMTNLWKDNQKSVLAISPSIKILVDPDEKNPDLKDKPSLNTILKYVNIMENGQQGDTGGELTEGRRGAAVTAVVGLQLMYEETTDSSLKEDIIKVMDSTYDYGVLVYGRGSLDTTRSRSNSDIVAVRSWY